MWESAGIASKVASDTPSSSSGSYSRDDDVKVQISIAMLQPDFRFWKAQFAGKECGKSRLAISHCLTALQY
jgi:hypothetical protein